MEWTAYATRSTCPGCVSSASAYATTDRHSEKSPSTPNGELSGTGVPRNAPSTRMSPNEAARNTADLRRSREVTSPNGFWRGAGGAVGAPLHGTPGRGPLTPQLPTRGGQPPHGG